MLEKGIESFVKKIEIELEPDFLTSSVSLSKVFQFKIQNSCKIKFKLNFIHHQAMTEKYLMKLLGRIVTKKNRFIYLKFFQAVILPPNL